jgi:hypothetical protein
MAYVCLVPSISIGTRIFVHENKCITIDGYNQKEYLRDPNLVLYVAVKWVPSVNRLHPHIKAFHEGRLFDTYELDNEWEYGWGAYNIPNISGRYIFQFLPDYGAEPEMSIFCDVVDELDADEVGEEVPDWDVLPDIDESGYFKVIRDLIEDESDKTNGRIGTTLLSIGATNTNISNLIAGLNNADNTKLTNDVNDLIKEYNNHFNLKDGVYASYLNDIKHSIDNLDIPDLSGLTATIEDTKEAIEALTIPNMTGVTNSINSLTSSLNELEIPSLGQISGLTNSIASKLTDYLNVLLNTVVRERNNIFRHFDVGIANLYIDIKNKIDDINIEMPEMDFPTVDSIKEMFISAASEIADRILERIWDEIERRYEK